MNAYCLHCRTGRAVAGHRGLCRHCYDDREIRYRYGRLPVHERYREPTEEELEATIAEQSAIIPPWWQAEAARHEQAEREREGHQPNVAALLLRRLWQQGRWCRR